MSALERAGRRSRAWLAAPAVPLVLVAGLAGGPVLGLAVAVAALQLALLAPGAAGAADAVGDALGSSWVAAGRAGGRAAGRAMRVAAMVLLRALPAMVGGLAVLLLLDWGIGAAWDRARGTPTGQAVDAISLATADLPPSTDERVDSPAYAGTPWAERYFAELEAVPFTYVPFLGPRESAVHGRYINSVDGERASYEPPGAAGPDAVEVWFLGGSTLWGEGQRDVHTIPSEVARLAERDGVALRAVNLGERGYTAFQEFLVFERELARRDPPDVAVFYHGANEQYSLLEAPENLGAQPSIYQLAVYDDAFHRAPPAPGQQPPPEPTVLEDYRATGIVNRLLRRVRAGLERPAGAEDGPDLPPLVALERSQDEAAQIYRRSVALIRHAAAEHGVPTEIFWQPGTEPAPAGTRDDYHDLGRRVARVGGGIDISDALLDAPAPVYIDGLHTNELGARLSAAAVWEHLAPTVERVRR